MAAQRTAQKEISDDLKRFERDLSRTVGYVSHDSLVRIDRRVRDITRRHAASLRARREAERREAATPSRDGI
jgi:hypothetical protein